MCLILSPSKDEVGMIVRSSWFDGLAMRTLLVAIATATFLAHADSLLAEEDLVAVHLGPATFSVPPSWLEWEGGDVADGRTVKDVFLTPPTTAFDGTDGVSTSGIDDIVILLRHDVFEGSSADSIQYTLTKATEEYGVAQPEDARFAFGDIPFSTLYGGLTANAGKSATHPLILIGSVQSPVYGTMLVSARVEQPDAIATHRIYVLSAITEAYGAQFNVLVHLEASRPLLATDLGLVDAAVRVLTEGAPD